MLTPLMRAENAIEHKHLLSVEVSDVKIDYSV